MEVSELDSALIETLQYSDSTNPDTQDIDQDTEQDEVSLVEYARFHKLSQDYTSHNPLYPSGLPSPPTATDRDLHDAELSATWLLADSTIEERWTVNTSTALFLREMLVMEKNVDELEYLTKHNEIRAAKVEPPLLRTDSQLDSHYFTNRKVTRTDLEDMDLAPFPVDEQNDEGLQWPTSMHQLPVAKDKEALFEKLEVNKTTLAFLRETLYSVPTAAEQEALIVADLTGRRKKAVESATPPLLPLSPPYSPGIPASPAAELPLTSTPEDLLALDTEIVENTIMQDDKLGPGAANLSVYDIPTSSSLKEESSSSPIKRRRPEGLKVEGPLTPQTAVESPFKKTKTVSFMEDLYQKIPNYARPFSPDKPRKEQDGNEDVFDDECDRIFNDINKMVEPAVREVENEQLQMADSTMRVEVPVIDHSVPPAPWNVFAPKRLVERPEGPSELDGQRRLLRSICASLLESQRSWTGARRNTDLSWSPFPMYLGKVAVQEEFDDGSLGRYMADLSFNDPVDTATLMWKPDGLRILDVPEDDDEELEPADYGEETDQLDALIRNHPVAVAESKGGQQRVPAPKKEKAAESNVEKGAIGIPEPEVEGDPRANRSTSLMFGGFSASGSLSRFMQVQTGKMESGKPTMQTVPPRQPIQNPVPTPAKPAERPQQRQEEELAALPPLPMPRLGAPSSPQQFIISSTLLTQRSFLREIERLHPAAELIERDFSVRPAIPASVNANTHPEKLEEADVLLSPGSGLLLTTLQKIKQKPLPGQPVTTGIRHRLQRLAPRYEHLVVLVSEGSLGNATLNPENSTRRPLDERDCEAIVSLISFCATLTADVQITYVPGGEAMLAAWTVSCMMRYGLDDPSIKLIQEETLWEGFLRQAGMDSFSAQAVLVALKLQESTGDHGRPDPMYSGLAVFVTMDEEERVSRFAALMGGERVLRSLSRALDQRWVAVAGAANMNMGLDVR